MAGSRGSDKSGKSRLMKPTYVAMTVSVPTSLLLAFDEECARRGYTRSEAIRMAMRHLLEVWTGRRM